MHFPRLSIALPALLALFVGPLAACGGGSDDDDDMTSADAGPPLNHPPAAGPAQAPDGTGTASFAVRKLYLGEADRDGTPNSMNGWKNYGYDLDGKSSI